MPNSLRILVLGKLHRDLKSPNILLASTKSDRLIAKVADFGLAKGLQTLSKDTSSSEARHEKRKSSTSDITEESKDDGAQSSTTHTNIEDVALKLEIMKKTYGHRPWARNPRHRPYGTKAGCERDV